MSLQPVAVGGGACRAGGGRTLLALSLDAYSALVRLESAMLSWSDCSFCWMPASMAGCWGCWAAAGRPSAAYSCSGGSSRRNLRAAGQSSQSTENVAAKMLQQREKCSR
jgi:hypothetical protein